MEDQRYFEEGYIETNYFGYIAEAVIVLGPYIEENYLEVDYFKDNGSFATLSCELTEVVGQTVEASGTWTASASVVASVGKITQASADMGALFSPSITANAQRAGELALFAAFAQSLDAERFRSADVTLETIVNLSLQSDIIRASSSSLSASFDQSTLTARFRDTQSDLAVSTSATATATRIRQGASDFTSAFTLTADVIKPVNFEMIWSASTALTATAISYVGKTFSYNRPHDFTQFAGDYSRDTSIVKWNDSSLKLGDSTSSTFGIWFTDSANPIPVIASGQDFAFEFYYYVDSNDIYGSTNEIIFEIGAVLRIVQSGLSAELEPSITLEKPDASDITFTASTPSTFNNQWNHIAVKRTSGTITAYVNGAQFDDSISYSGQIGYGNSGNFLPDGRIRIANPVNTTMRFDAISLRVGDDTIYGPNNAPVNDFDTTVFFYPFENANGYTYDQDYLGVVLEAQADLTAQFTLTADATETESGSADLTSAFTTNIDASKITFNEILPTAFSALTATATRIKQFSVTLDSEFAQSATAVKLTEAISNQSSAFTQTASVNAIRQGITDFDAIATQITIAAKIGDFFVNADSAASLDIDVSKITGFASDLDSAFAQTTLAIKAVSAASDLNSAFAQATLGARIRYGEIALDTALQQVTDAVKTVSVDSTMQAQASVQIDASKFSGNPADLFSEFAFTATPSVTRTDSATLDSAFTQIASAIKAVEAIANTSATADISTTALRIRPGILEFDSIATQLSVVAKIGNTLVDMPTTASMTVAANVLAENSVPCEVFANISIDAERIRSTDSNFDGGMQAILNVVAISEISGSADLTASSTLGATANVIRDATANLGALFSPSITVNAQRAGEIATFTAATLELEPTRIRLGVINATSTASVQAIGGITVSASASISSAFSVSADGKFIVLLDQLTYVIPRETRSFTIDRESRSFSIHRETRTYTIPE